MVEKAAGLGRVQSDGDRVSLLDSLLFKLVGAYYWNPREAMSVMSVQAWFIKTCGRSVHNERMPVFQLTQVMLKRDMFINSETAKGLFSAPG